MRLSLLPELRFKRLWLSLGLLMIAVITVACLMPSSRLPETGTSDKTNHILSFGTLGFWFGGILVRRGLLVLGVLLVAFGGAIEIAQGLMQWGRSAEWLDLLADAAGVAIGIALVMTPLGRWAQWVEQRLVRVPA